MIVGFFKVFSLQCNKYVGQKQYGCRDAAFLGSPSTVLTGAGMERSAMTDSTERFRHCALLHSGFCWEKFRTCRRTATWTKRLPVAVEKLGEEVRMKDVFA